MIIIVGQWGQAESMQIRLSGNSEGIWNISLGPVRRCRGYQKGLSRKSKADQVQDGSHERYLQEGYWRGKGISRPLWFGEGKVSPQNRWGFGEGKVSP